MRMSTERIVTLVVIVVSGAVVGITTFYNESPIILDILEENDPTNSRGTLMSPTNYIKENIDAFVTNHLLKPPSNKPYNITSSNLNARHAKRRTSWKFLYKYVQYLFDDQSNGFFLEAGARDGVTLSNTLWLEAKMGWKGLLIEPDLANYLALMKKNRKAWTVNACLSTSQFLNFSIFKSVFTTFYKSSPTRDNNKWQWPFREHSFVVDSKNTLDSELFSPHYFYEYSTVLCLPVGHLLKILNISVIDFFNLDIEGDELRVLELFPWQTVKLRTILIKYGNSTRSKEDLISFLEGKGYVLVYQSPYEDYYFILDNETNLLLKAKD